MPSLTFDISRGCSNKFYSLLQYQMIIPLEEPRPIWEVLQKLPGFSQQYIYDTVQTIFVNGSAADSLDQHLYPGDKLSLSAAMPGLAGAIFRRDGQHKSLRSKPQQPLAESSEEGRIFLKLFNSIAADRGFELLNEGILINSSDLIKFLTTRPDPIVSVIKNIKRDGQVLSFEQLIEDSAERTYSFKIREIDNS